MNVSMFCRIFIVFNVILLCWSTSVYSQEIETLVAKLLAQNQALTARIDQIEHELGKEKSTNVLLTRKVETLEARLDQDEETIHTLRKNRQSRQLNEATCAFTAVVTPSDLTNLQPGQPIIFDRTITNMAHAYDSTTGVFTAPIRGVYVFHMDVMVEPGNNEYLEFVKDGAHVMYNYIHAKGGLDDVSSSRSVVLELDKGNQFWIRTTQSASHGSGTLHGNEFSAFSGWLLAITE